LAQDTARRLDLIERYNIEIPVFKWQDRCIARLSVQGYNSKGQMDLLVEALADLLKLSSGRARKAS
jgi:isopenicillin-N epimerase